MVGYVPVSSPGFLPRDKRQTLVAIGPSGADYSTDDGANWMVLEGPGFDTLSFARGTTVGWAAGKNGTLAKLTFGSK